MLSHVAGQLKGVIVFLNFDGSAISREANELNNRGFEALSNVMRGVIKILGKGKPGSTSSTLQLPITVFTADDPAKNPMPPPTKPRAGMHIGA